jgi:hypothetical protein
MEQCLIVGSKLSNTVTLIVGSKLSNTNTVSNKNQISGNKSEAFSVTPNKKPLK